MPGGTRTSDATNGIPRLIQPLAIVAIALYLVPSGAHVAELANKMALTPVEYMTAQKLYAGWSWFAIVILAALAITLANTIIVRASRAALAWSCVALVALVSTQAVFWIYTAPVNAVTRSWTIMPEPFEAARRQWEYSHCASAFLTFVALIAIVMSVLKFGEQRSKQLT